MHPSERATLAERASGGNQPENAGSQPQTAGRRGGPFRLPPTRWLWLIAHAVGLVSAAVFLVQGVRYQDCELVGVIVNGNWGPFHYHPSADDLAVPLALAYLIVVPAISVATVLWRAVRWRQLRWQSVVDVAANLVVSVAVLMMILGGGLQTDHAAFCERSSVVWAVVWWFVVIAAAIVVNSPPRRLRARLVPQRPMRARSSIEA